MDDKIRFDAEGRPHLRGTLLREASVIELLTPDDDLPMVGRVYRSQPTSRWSPGRLARTRFYAFEYPYAVDIVEGMVAYRLEPGYTVKSKVVTHRSRSQIKASGASLLSDGAAGEATSEQARPSMEPYFRHVVVSLAAGPTNDQAAVPAWNLGRQQRLWDLVRHQRGPLHDAGLISDEEYAALAEDHEAVARLEDYDETLQELAMLQSAARDLLDWINRTTAYPGAGTTAGDPPVRAVRVLLQGASRKSNPLQVKK